MPIRRLPQSLINKIAAGEVIERPASVVKELMENAVDAGASRIDVFVEQGGLEKIRVVDNGCGIPVEELPLALASHATSKIAETDDLFHVSTLGFRGEALASIAEVSRLILRSRTPESTSGAEITAVGGELGEPMPCGCPVGTSVEVQNLFFNTPVRRKFLRTAVTEFGHISEAFTRIALALPNIHFTLRHNDKTVFDLAAGESWLERIALFFGRELADSLIWVESTDGDVNISGYVAHPKQNRSHNRMQYFFLNGRHIRDRALQHALCEAYRGLLMVGRQPIAFLMMRMPPELVDVNVHPTKLEVRFQDSGKLYSQLLGTLRNKFLTTDLNTRVQTAQDTENNSLDQAGQLRQQLVEWAKGKVSTWGRESCLPAREFDADHECHDDGHGMLRPACIKMQSSDTASEGYRTFGQEKYVETPANQRSSGLQNVPDHQPRALQVHNRYLVAETDDGITIIDQHALHERILYEQLRKKIASGTIEMQNLLVPEAVDLSPTEAAAALEHRDLLLQLGVKVAPFGGSTILLEAYPAMLANMNPSEILRALLEQILAGVKQPDRRDLLDELLHTIACKAAIKAGDRLAPEEIAALLEQRHLVEDAHHCPHGRPTALVFTREELDRQFKRM